MPLADSKLRPIETILSGPAASIMGVQALTRRADENYVIIDLGGTTTDLAAVVGGEVLFERDGATISGFKTLVPALLTRSIGLGGDSAIAYDPQGKSFKIGPPRRAGTPPACLGGAALTPPTDAAVALELAQVGERGRAVNAWRAWGGAELGLPWEELAQKVLDAFIDRLAGAVQSLYAELENVPLYTVSEILTPPPEVRPPRAVVGLGAPAPVFIPLLAQQLKLPWEAVSFAAGANAVGGAAAARATMGGLTLHADTELGVATIPEMGFREQIKRPMFLICPGHAGWRRQRRKSLPKQRATPPSRKSISWRKKAFIWCAGFIR